MIQNNTTVPGVAWGQGCRAWEVLGTSELSVKHERMPPSTSEVRHHHRYAQQFFFVLSGTLKIEIAGAVHVLQPQDGLSVAPEAPHQAINDSDGVVEFLVISAPSTSGDRVEVD